MANSGAIFVTGSSARNLDIFDHHVIARKQPDVTILDDFSVRCNERSFAHTAHEQVTLRPKCDVAGVRARIYLYRVSILRRTSCRRDGLELAIRTHSQHAPRRPIQRLPFNVLDLGLRASVMLPGPFHVLPILARLRQLCRHRVNCRNLLDGVQ